MRVQIAICTWNRSWMLDRTLAQIRNLSIPDDTQLELIIVDNASTDDTAEVIDHYRGHLQIKDLKENRQGHCFARNCAIEAADGDLLIWTDDDVLVDENWVIGYVEAARKQPEMSFWGGPIIPKFDEHRPDWLKSNWELCKGCFAARDLGDRSVEFSEQVLPYGANFGVRTSVQREFAFDIEMGRRGNEVVGEDEVDMMRRMIKRGFRGRWIPSAKLFHLIPPERMTEQYVGDYFFGQGKTEAMRNWKGAGSPASLQWESIAQRVLYRVKRPYAPARVWLTHLVRSALAGGKRSGLQKVRAAKR